MIVVDDGSAPPAACTGAGVRVLRHEVSRGPAAARNTGWRSATGDAVLFLDDDVVPADDLLRRAEEALRRHGSSVAGIESVVAPDDEAAAADPLARTLRTAGGGHSAAIVFWRSALERVGGFDERFPDAAGEDYDLCWRLTDAVGPILCEPALRAWHAVYPANGYRAWQARRRRARPSVVRLFVKHPHRFPPPFLPGWLRPLIRWLLPSPTPAAIATYFALTSLVDLATSGRQTRSPWQLGRLVAYHGGNLVTIVLDIARIRRWHRSASQDARGEAAVR
jgi:GT2 family glycosyltransferase